MTEDKKEVQEVKLTAQELQLISQVFAGARWTGAEWEQTIKPMLAKIATMARGLQTPASPE